MKRKIFEDWLRKKINLKEDTIKSYCDDLERISGLAIEENIVEVSLYDVSAPDLIVEIENKLRKSEKYILENKKYNYRYNRSLKLYRQFICGEEPDGNYNNPIYKTYQKMLSENKLLTEKQLEESYNLFKSKFDPDKLKSVDGEALLELMFDHGNRGSLVYWLEFKNDDEFQTPRFGGIGGGTALKFGIYKRKEDGKWITGISEDMQEIEINEAIDIAREKRELLIKGAEIISEISNDSDDS